MKALHWSKGLYLPCDSIFYILYYSFYIIVFIFAYLLLIQYGLQQKYYCKNYLFAQVLLLIDKIITGFNECVIF